MRLVTFGASFYEVLLPLGFQIQGKRALMPHFEEICFFAEVGAIVKWEEIARIRLVFDIKWYKDLKFNHFKLAPKVSKTPKTLECVEISQKVVTGDAMHTQKALSGQIVRQGGDYIFPVKENQTSLYKNIQQLFAPEYPKAGFGKIKTDFMTVEKVNKGHGRLEKRILTIIGLTQN